MGRRTGWMVGALLLAITIAGFLCSFDSNSSFSYAQPQALTRKPPDTFLTDYVWPTDAGRKLTSVLADFRRTHFHGGIDISTGRTTGYSVFAARDGYVSRIVVGPTGYGKQLWVHHSDGYFTTYSHLRNFSPEIDSLVRREQLRQERYPVAIECAPTSFPVKKGDLIAFTGETGTGSPHLHFEIRDPTNGFINPLLASGFTVADDSLPRFLRLAVTSIGENSFVNSSSQSRVFTFREPLQGVQSIAETLHVFGTFGFAVDVRDRINDSRFNSGVYSNSLFLDDSLIYSFQFDRAPSQEDQLVGLHYDFRLMSGQEGRFAKLYMDSPNRLPFIQTRRPNAGIVNTEAFSNGLHRFKIVARDFLNNASELNVIVMFTQRPDFGAIADSLTRLAKWKAPITRKQASKRFEVDATMEHYIHEEYVRILLRTKGKFTGRPLMALREADVSRSLEVTPVTQSLFSATFRPTALLSCPRQLTARCEVDGRPTTVLHQFDLHSVQRKNQAPLPFDNGRMQILVDSTSFFRLSFLEVEVQHEKKDDVTSYSIGPPFAVLQKGLTVRVHSDKNDPQQALYVRQRGSNWRLLSKDREGSYFIGRLDRALGSVAVLRDTKPPAVRRLSFPSRHSKLPHIISFSVRDDLSGVENKDLKLYIDNKFVIPEIDGEHRRVVNRLPEPLARGKHSLRILLKDRLGNSSELRKTFSVR